MRTMKAVSALLGVVAAVALFGRVLSDRRRG